MVFRRCAAASHAEYLARARQAVVAPALDAAGGYPQRAGDIELPVRVTLAAGVDLGALVDHEAAQGAEPENPELDAAASAS